MEKPPLITAPIYLSGAPLPDRVSEKALTVCKKTAPFFGLIGATLLGATAAYFVPKFLDHYLQPGDDSDNVELEVEPRND